MGRSRVGVAVEPPLLADLLVRALWAPDRDVRRDPGLDYSSYDVVVISPARASDAPAPTVICLPDDEGGAGRGTVTSHRRSRAVPIDTVDAILALVHAGCAEA